MITIGLIIFRELIEISLLLSMVLSVIRDYDKKILAVLTGLVLGISGSIICGSLLTEISNMYHGYGQEIFEICILFLSIILIFVTVNWAQGGLDTTKDRLQNLNPDRRLFAIVLMVSLIVLREGIEIFLFIYGAMLSKQVTLSQLILGIICAMGLVIPLNIAMYYGLTKFFYKSLFTITTWLLTFLAAGMGARIGNLLISIEMINVDTTPLWDSSFLITNYSTIGRMLNNIFGYNAQPNVIEASFYILTIIFIQINKVFKLKKYLNFFAK